MAQAVSKIPIVWKTKQSVADRLLGKVGRPLFDQLLAKSQAMAAKRRWPLQKIKVDYYQDPEVDWEYMILTLDFDCPRLRAEKLWVNYLKTVRAMREGQEGQAGDILAEMVHYDFESDP
jgi:hypothetical protein